jgi:hypothetical protein
MAIVVLDRLRHAPHGQLVTRLGELWRERPMLGNLRRLAAL